MTKERLRKLLIVAILATVPLYCFLFPFVRGYLRPDQDYFFKGVIPYLLPVILIGPPLATVIVAFVFRVGMRWKLLAICGSLYVASIAAFIASRSGIKEWTIGVAYNFRLTKDPVRIQQWATEVLARHKDGKLETKPEGEPWAVGKELLAEREIPHYIHTLWREKPSIGIATMTSTGDLIAPAETDRTLVDSPGGPSTWVQCVAFSWYINGILVGPPDFKPTWKPYYILQIIPGVYAYSGIK